MDDIIPSHLGIDNKGTRSGEEHKEKQLKSGEEEEGEFLILSVDGGGTRGSLALYFLQHMEAAIIRCSKSGGSDESTTLLVHDLFDMFAGTSSGGMLAIRLGLRRSSIVEIRQEFSDETARSIMKESFLDKICDNVQFKPKYDGREKERVLQRALGVETRFERSATGKFIVVPAYDVQKWESVFFVNHYYASGSEDSPLAWKIADATSAAPTYFPAVHLQTSCADVCEAMPDCPRLEAINSHFVDGGVNKNNPALTAALIARRYLRNNGIKKRIRVLSVGTGVRGAGVSGDHAVSFGGIQWLTHDLLGMLMNETHTDQELQLLLDDPKRDYVRVNSSLEAAGVSGDLDDTSEDNFLKMKQLSCEWWQQHAETVFRFLHLPFSEDVATSLPVDEL